MKLTKKQHTELTKKKFQPWFCDSCSTLEKQKHTHDPFKEIGDLFSTENLHPPATAKHGAEIDVRNFKESN
jgi:hypothetical protein